MIQAIAFVIAYSLIIGLAALYRDAAKRAYESENRSNDERWSKLDALTLAEWLLAMAFVFGWIPAMLTVLLFPEAPR